MPSIGIGLIGTGYMGKCHALAWNAVGPVFGDCPIVRLVHLADVDATLANQKAAAFGFSRSTGNWRDLLSDPDVEVISITAPNAFHPEMAIEALNAGKHIWCEKPMAPKFADALAMREAARKSGRAAVLGYNYIQNPMVRQIEKFLAEDAIGEVNHVRIEMDEDFMADPAEFFYWKSDASSGYGALDDFAVHPLSLIRMLFGRIASVTTDMARPYSDRPVRGGGRRAVETHDIASVLFRLEQGASGVLMTNRAAWGRKGRLALQVFGSKGSIVYDQERMNEVQIYRTGTAAGEAGYTSILAAPSHPPYGMFVPAPGHGLGFNDLKVIECRHLLARIAGEPAHVIDFEKGVDIERAVHAMAAAHEKRGWVDIEYD
ncbi:MAG: Gfo/Idh/MocA family oxidoreductase [Hoeflea sp.]|uniref:Gfo/Idh/MocA family protein n=1 Tax=Hoeflea sp. TaxID=1940281 RepID=UPI001D535166|nr:Gfo/Idh/MocA family oxidoreductase [Hoeflea sp.]MBU4528071.1 Gfo/Idh/MocA family oxidoreductase [Alphaproteobacteria bacterium]MBU4543668.1 Gfo/Idh/MocA family oxidoreductase [Alphaproteobacteria bacterium]MBU4548534.1 Gfo/Idh/MocA family oxidoreductase [Alphaproteobacteria bacterium]MBV1725701.1 Gfo/Idh/MocA family oxidoreductase [Hoeflea sp.]MBV1762057.1 Gfo/Idh/MocA family oxidoreductase [Hoeflea sp.]